MAKVVYVQIYDTTAKTMSWEKVGGNITSSNEMLYDKDALCLMSATKSWRLQASDAGVLTLVEVV